VGQTQLDRIKTLESALASDQTEEERKSEHCSSSENTPSESSSHEESKEPNSKLDFSHLGQDIGTQDVVRVILLVTSDDYWNSEDIGSLSVLSKGQFKLLGKLCELAPASAFTARVDKLKAEMKEPILILFDLGGTLCYRTGPEGLAELGRANYVLRKHVHYFRPYSSELLQGVLKHPRAKVGFLTSITRQNALGLVQAFFKQRGLENHKADLFYLFDQEFSSPDPAGPETWSTKRSLQKVWESAKCKKEGFDESNTLVLDSDAFKVRDDRSNCIIVPPYTKDAVFTSKKDQSAQEKTMKELLTFVSSILDQAETVPDFLKQNHLGDVAFDWDTYLAQFKQAADERAGVPKVTQKETGQSSSVAELTEKLGKTSLNDN